MSSQGSVLLLFRPLNYLIFIFVQSKDISDGVFLGLQIVGQIF